MEIGYDPTRVRDLSRRTVVSIESLTSLKSSDPAATDALRAIRLTRQNLEDLWMPLLREIENSRAMVSWITTALDTVQASGARLAEWFTHQSQDGPDADLGWTEYTEKTNQEVLDWLAYASNIPFPWDEHFGHTTTAIQGFSADLADRVRSDSGFATILIALAPTTPLIARATGEVHFPAEFTGEVVTSMLGSTPWFGGLEAQSKAKAVQVAMSTLLTSPGTILDVLSDSDVLYSLAKWPLLETDLVQKFTTAGLYEALLIDADRLGDGYNVLRELTRLTNGPLDGGMAPGLARGVAISMDAYLETLAPAIRKKGTDSVRIIAPEYNVVLTIGTYDDVVGLFGAVMRDAPAQAAIGAALGGYTQELVNQLGDKVIDYAGLEYVVRFTNLLSDAAHAEQAELVMAAAADEAFRRQVGGAVRTGINVGLTLSGVGAIARGFTNQALNLATEWAVRITPENMVTEPFRDRTYDLITVTAIRLVAENPSVRPSLGLTTIPAGSWKKVDELLEDIENSRDPEDRANAVKDLDDYIEDDEPSLGGYMKEVRNVEGMSELTQDRNATGAG